jgi:outer membrane receptor for ferrienterochelin and colicins
VKNLIFLFSVLISANCLLKTCDKRKRTLWNIVLKNIKPTPVKLMVYFNTVPSTKKSSYTGFKSQSQDIVITDSSEVILNFNLRENNTLDEVVTGTLKPVSRLESPVPVEVYKPVFFSENPTANIRSIAKCKWTTA